MYKRIAKSTALAIAIAAPAEGLRQVAYYDPPGILTVCRGHTGPDVISGKLYSLSECDSLMDADMHKAVETVDKCVPNLAEPVLAAFSDAVYNMGPTIACNPSKSTAARYLKSGNIKQACMELPRWNKAKIAGIAVTLPGLTKRREKERDLCLEGL